MILALILLLGCFAGCAKKSKTTELVFWVHQEEAWVKSFEKMITAFEAENPDVKVKLEVFPYDEFEAKIQTSLMSKTADVDCFEMWGGWAVDFAPTGALAAMPDDMAKTVRAECYDATYGTLDYEGKLYGMPMEFNIECGAILVNKQLQADYGLDNPTTWDEMIADAKIAVENGKEGYDFVDMDQVTFNFLDMILSQGGQYLNEDGKSVNVTSPEAVKAFTEMANLVAEGVANMDGLTVKGDMDIHQHLFAGDSLYVSKGPWTIADGITTFELTFGEDFDYVAKPWYGGKVAFPADTGWSFAVNASSEKLDAAWRFLNFMFKDENILDHNVACGQIPSKKAVAQSAEYSEKFPYVAPLLGNLEGGQFIGYFNSDVLKQTIAEVFTDYCTSDKYASVEDALADLQAKLDAKL